MRKVQKDTLKANHLMLKNVKPITNTQETVFASENHMLLHGVAGSGKTYVALYLAMISIKAGEHDKVVIIRSAVPTRDMGFLPGNDKDKAQVYEAPYSEILADLFERGDAYSILKSKGEVEFKTTSFIRGITIRDSVVIVDEIQNMSFQELDSIITRIGPNCRVILCGDYNQADLPGTGVLKFMSIIRHMESFDFIEFTTDDIVRSGLVKEYILAKVKNNESNSKQ